jgi:uncharacterized delta-60 repeat protein
MRLLALTAALFAGACSSILGIHPPHEQVDAGSVVDAPGDFTIEITTPAPRVPQGGFDFLDVAITRTNFAAPIVVNIPQPLADVTVTPVTLAGSATTGSLVLTGTSGLTVGSTLPTLTLVATSGSLEHDIQFTAIVTVKPGLADTTFGSNGLALHPYGTLGADYADLSIASNGSITAVGSETTAIQTFALIARWTGSGAVDTTFAGSGSKAVNQGAPSSTPSEFLSIAQQSSSGHVIAVGDSRDSSLMMFPIAWLASFDGSGNEVQAFGDMQSNDFIDTGGGYGVNEPSIGAVVALADDSLVAVTVNLLPSSPSSTAISKQTAPGVRDTTFNGGAPLALPISIGLAGAGAGALAADAARLTTYVCGTGSAGPVVIHITASGSFDSAFGSGGTVALGSAATAATAIAVQPADGHIVVAGAPAFVARLLPTGAFDTSFGSNGVANLSSLSSTFTAIAAVAIQADGRILVAGNTTPTGTALVVRLLADGTVDPSYGSAGEATVFLGSFGSVAELRLQSDGNAVGCGTGGEGSEAEASLFRVTF